MNTITLRHGEVALVDDDDYERLSQFKWHLLDGYACHTVNGHSIPMHRYILVIPCGMTSDHVNRNRLDNRRNNLRLATISQNRANSTHRTGYTSKYNGVYWRKHRSRWAAAITCNGKREFLGYYKDETAAARAYDKRALELFGEFANLNFPLGASSAESV